MLPETIDYEPLPDDQSRVDEQTIINFNWTENYIVTQAEAEKIANPDWVIQNLVIRGHVVVIAAKPNGGKTTIFMHVAEQMVKSGYKVYYVNSDISGGDAKHDIYRARKAGVTLLLPDLKGKSMEQVVNTLDAMNQSEGADFNNVVFIFDTLKKMTDVIGKGSVRVLFSLLRGLSAKGMTSILLAHTNKYNADDGTPVFEGVGDIKSDSDELIYFVPQKNPDGSLVVSTLPDKVRGDFKPISFFIGVDRSVKQLDEYVDVARENVAKSALDNDSQIIDAINQALAENLNKQLDIVAYCHENFGINAKSTRRVLKIYIENSPVKQLWRTARGMKNAVFYYLLGENTPPPEITG